ncbi:MAG: non-ribosomal peptide synthetase, partial [Vicinamibacteria bacterium]
TDFAWKNLDEPLSVVYRERPIDFAIVDQPRDGEEEIERILREDRAQPIDLGKAPLARLRLFRVSENLHYFLWSFHHILLDGWSLGILLKEVFALYQSFRFSSGKPALPKAPPYRDYIAWLSNQRRRSPGGPFWRRVLSGFREPNRLSWNHGAVTEHREIHFSLPPEVGERLHAVVRRNHLTLNSLIQGLWALVVCRESGDDDVVFGATVSGRPSELRGVENMVGLFINTLPVRTRIRREAPFVAWVGELQKLAVECRQHEHTPPLEVLGASEVPRGLPLYESLLVFENYPLDQDLKRPANDLAITGARYWSHTELPLHLRVRPGDPLRLDLTYDRSAVDDERAESILAFLSTALAAVVDRPERSCSDLLLLDAGARASVTMIPLPPRGGFVPFETEVGSSIPQRFREVVRKRGGRIAIESGARSWTYEEIDRASDSLAAELGERLPAGARVGLLLPHDAPMVVALLAALKAGKAYVPLDPHFPRRRLEDILEDARPELLVTSARSLGLARELSRGGIPLVDIDAAGAREGTTSLEGPLPPDALAYLLYTSGSTGRPKGVMQSHRNVLHHVRAYTRSLGIDGEDRLTLLSSFGFDAAVLDVFGALLNGATLIPFDIRERGFAPLGRFLDEKRITVYHSTPTVFRAFAESQKPGARFPRVRLVVLGGEEVVPSDGDLFERHFTEDSVLVNLFGATEATLSHLHPLYRRSGAAGSVPLGFPVEGTEAWLLDREGRRTVPFGEIGIRSPYLALGYWNRPEETRERFLAVPGSEERIYRTGDLGRLRSDGTLEFLGRKDFLVKIRGQRVETGEVESALAESGRVAKSLVVAQEIEGEPALVAYVVPKSPPPAESDLRSFLWKRLPDPMIPARFQFLASLPMTLTGKVDRMALLSLAQGADPSAARPDPESEGDVPRTPVEELVSEIWRHVLRAGSKRIPLHANFFDIGGHSLRLTQVASRLTEALGAEVPLRDLFEHPTIETLARRLERRFPELGPALVKSIETIENRAHD